MTSDTDFREYRIAILGDIKRINQTLGKLQDAILDLTVEVSQLKITDKIRSSMWGGLGGIVSTVLLTLVIERMLRG